MQKLKEILCLSNVFQLIFVIITIMRISHANLGITLIMILLALGGIYNIVIGTLTMLEYLPTEFAGVASISSSFTIVLGLFIFVLVYGLSKRKGWALLLTIAFMAFGIIASILNIIYTSAFELPSTFGIAGVILFSLAIYYLTKSNVRAAFQ